MYKNVYEIILDLKIAIDQEEMVDILQRHNLPALKLWLKYVFDDRIQFHDLDLDNLEWERDMFAGRDGLNTFSTNSHLVYLFIKDHPKAAPALTIAKRRDLLASMLESMDGREADIFIDMLRKKPRVKELTKEVALRAFPDLLS